MDKKQEEKFMYNEEKRFQNNPHLYTPNDLCSYFKNIGKIASKLKNGQTQYGTACLIDKNLLLTCAHNLVFEGKPIKPKKMRFMRAQNGKEIEEDIFVVYAYRIPFQYLQNYQDLEERAKYDYALLHVYNKKVQTLHSMSAWSHMPLQEFEGLDPQKIKQMQYYIQIFGYSYHKQDQNNKQYFMYGSSTNQIQFEEEKDQKTIKYLNYRLNTETGLSGAPIVNYWQSGAFRILGIHTLGSSDYHKCNRGILFTKAIREQIDRWAQQLIGQEKKLYIENSKIKRGLKLPSESIDYVNTDSSDTQSDYDTPAGSKKNVNKDKQEKGQRLPNQKGQRPSNEKGQRPFNKQIQFYKQNPKPKQMLIQNIPKTYHINLISGDKITDLSTAYRNLYMQIQKDLVFNEQSHLMSNPKNISPERRSQFPAKVRQNGKKQKEQNVKKQEEQKQQNKQQNRQLEEKKQIATNKELIEHIKPKTCENLHKLQIKNMYFDYKLLIKLTNLKHIILEKTQCSQIHPIPSFYQNSLISFASNHNSLTKIENIFHLKSLFILSLHHNLIKKIPYDICRLQKLQEINLSFNVLEEIPRQVFDLQLLQKIDVSENLITEIPSDVLNAPRLTDFDIEYNQLWRINLKVEDCEKNKLEYLNLRMKGNLEINKRQPENQDLEKLLRAMEAYLSFFQY